MKEAGREILSQKSERGSRFSWAEWIALPTDGKWKEMGEMKSSQCPPVRPERTVAPQKWRKIRRTNARRPCKKSREAEVATAQRRRREVDNYQLMTHNGNY